jgi:hypothetical protein
MQWSSQHRCYEVWIVGTRFEDSPQANRISCCHTSVLETHEGGHYRRLSWRDSQTGESILKAATSKESLHDWRQSFETLLIDFCEYCALVPKARGAIEDSLCNNAWSIAFLTLYFLYVFTIFGLSWERGCIIVSLWRRQLDHHQKIVRLYYQHPSGIHTAVGSSKTLSFR